MPDITITFEDGKQHKYENAPDTLKPEDVYARAQKDFPDAKIKGIARGETTQTPKEPMYDSRTGAFTRGLLRSTLGAPGDIEKLFGVDIPEYFGQEKQVSPTGGETIFPTSEELKKTWLLGEPKKEKYPEYGTAGELTPALVGVAGLGKSLVQKATPYVERAVRAVKGTGEAEKLAGLQEQVLKEARAIQGQVPAGAEVAAEAKLASAEQAKAAAEQTANRVEQLLSNVQGMTPEQFVKVTRDTAVKLENDLIQAREKGAGLGEAIQNAGSGLKVSTGNLIDKINDIKNTVRNPTAESALNQIERLATNPSLVEGEGALEQLSIPQADSLRKTIDAAIKRRQLGDLAIDKETAYHLKELRKVLVSEATAVDKGYRDALGKFNTLSRPLDIFSEGELGKLTAKAVRTASGYAATESQVIGTLLRRGGESARMIERLQQANPEVRDAVKLYFSRQLFGEGGVPTANKMRSFLLENETVLKRLGLYDDFSSVKNSLQTAKDALERATLQKAEAERGVSSLGKLSQQAQAARQAELQIQSAPKEKAVEVTKSYIDQLYKANRISDARYTELLKQVDDFTKTAKSEAELRRKLLGAAGLVGAGTAAKIFGIVPSIFGGNP
jgi:hypothetical protein